MIGAPLTAVCAVCHNARKAAHSLLTTQRVVNSSADPAALNAPIPCAARSDLLQVLTDLCQEFARAVGFCDITVATSRMRFAVVAAQSVGSYGDNGNAF